MERVIFDGQSLVTTPTGNGVAVQLETDMLGVLTSETVGVAVTTYAQRLTTIATRYDDLLVDGVHSAVADLGGQSDLWNGLTPVELMIEAENYWAALREAGATAVIGMTIPPAANFVLNGTNYQRLVYNDLLRVSSAVDAVADFAHDSRLASYADTTYYSDGLHPTVLGARALSRLVRDILYLL